VSRRTTDDAVVFHYYFYLFIFFYFCFRAVKTPLTEFAHAAADVHEILARSDGERAVRIDVMTTRPRAYGLIAPGRGGDRAPGFGCDFGAGAAKRSKSNGNTPGMVSLCFSFAASLSRGTPT
jgi:hypothetical protein